MENKKILSNLLIQLTNSNTLSKNMQISYELFLQKLKQEKLLEIEKSTCKTRINIMHDLQVFINKQTDLKTYQDMIFISLLKSNFPHVINAKTLDEIELSLDKVEKKIYQILKTYIDTLLVMMQSFFILDEKKQKSIETFSAFALSIHDILLQNLFFEEEKEHFNAPLKQLLVVYISLYYKKIYG